MKDYCVRVAMILTLLISFFLTYKAHSHTGEVTINIDECPITLLDHKEILFNFFDAIEEGNTDKLLALKTTNLDTYTNYQMGQALLYYAAFLGEVDLIDTLVSKLDIDVNTQSQNGWTALHYAFLNPDTSSRIDIIYALIQLGANVEALDLDQIENELSWYKDITKERKIQFKYSPLKEREKAVKLALSSNIKQIAGLLQIKDKTLSSWVNQYKKEHNIPISKPHLQKLKSRAIKMVIRDKMEVKKSAKILDLSVSTVFLWVNQYKKEHNIPMKTRPVYSQKTKDKVIKMVIEEKIEVEKISKELDIPIATILKWIIQHRKKYKIPVKGLYSEELKERAINMVIKGNMNTVEVGKELGVSSNSVSFWVSQYKKKNNIPIKTPYPQELKNNAIQKVIKGENAKQVAKDLDISVVTLRGWVARYVKENNIQRSKPYSDTPKKRAIEMFKDNMTVKQIAEELNTSENTVSSRIVQYKRENNIPIKTQRAYSKEVRDEAIKMAIEDKIKITQIAKKLDISKNTVYSWVYHHKKRQGLEIRKKEYYPPELRDEAIEMVIKDKMDIAQVAQNLEVHKSDVFRWLRKHRKKEKVEKKKLEVKKAGDKEESLHLSRKDRFAKKSHQSKRIVKRKAKQSIDEDEWSSIQLDSESAYSEAVEEVLKENRYEEDVAREFGLNLEILKLRVRNRKYQYNHRLTQDINKKDI